MAKGDPLTSHQQSIVSRYYEHLDTITLQRLGEAVSDLYLSSGGARAEKLWDTVRRALEKMPVDSGRAAKIVNTKDVTALAALVGELNSRGGVKTSSGSAPPVSAPAPTAQAVPAAPTTAPAPAAPAASAPAATPGVVAPETLKSAMKAFRKRLKLTLLDDESKLGRSPLTSGAKSQVVAITPPNQFPREVWEELVKQGQLKKSGAGFYALVNP